MPNALPTMGRIIDQQQARTYLTEDQVRDAWRTCQRHAVTTCPSCLRIWPLHQLRRINVGYYPGELDATSTDAAAPTYREPPTLPPCGNRYQLACPICRTDVTDLTRMHIDACTLYPQR